MFIIFLDAGCAHESDWLKKKEERKENDFYLLIFLFLQEYLKLASKEGRGRKKGRSEGHAKKKRKEERKKEKEQEVTPIARDSIFYLT